jgi:hypothetical protein
MQQASQPDPQQQQMAQMAQQAQMQLQQAQTAALQGQANESEARASKYVVDAELAPQGIEIELIEAITRNLREGDEDDKEFERRMKIGQLAIKEANLNNQRKSGDTPRDNDTERNQQPTPTDQPSVQRSIRQIGLAGEQGQNFGGER